MRVQYLQLGLPGDDTSSDSIGGEDGISGTSFADVLSELLANATLTSDIEQSDTRSSQLPWQLFQQTTGTQLSHLQSTLSGTSHSADASDANNQYDTIIQNASAKYGVDASLIKAVIQQESGFNNSAKSAVGALGLMQLMPATAESLGVLDPFSPSQNIDGGTKYLKQLLDRYSGNVELALAAYNAGPGAVDKYGGVPPYAETKHYVQSILRNLNA
jgi:soluble lytic murein transglycosylase-like protein